MPSSSSSGSTGRPRVVAVYSTPIPGLTVSLDTRTLNNKTVQHGAAWVTEEQCQVLFETPEFIFESQHPEFPARLLFYCRPFITTPWIKYVRGVADFTYGTEGFAVSVHPRKTIGNVGPQVYPIVVPETTEDDE